MTPFASQRQRTLPEFPSARGRSVRLVQDPGASTESQLRERGEIGRLLSSAEGYLVLDEEGRPCGRLDHVRYERHADYPDEIVVRRGRRNAGTATRGRGSLEDGRRCIYPGSDFFVVFASVLLAPLSDAFTLSPVGVVASRFCSPQP